MFEERNGDMLQVNREYSFGEITKFLNDHPIDIVVSNTDPSFPLSTSRRFRVMETKCGYIHSKVVSYGIPNIGHVFYLEECR